VAQAVPPADADWAGWVKRCQEGDSTAITDAKNGISVSGPRLVAGKYTHRQQKDRAVLSGGETHRVDTV